MFSRQSDAEEVFGFSLNRNSCLKNSFLKRQQLWKNLLFYKTKRSSEVFLLDLESVTEKKNFRKLCRIYKNQEGSGPGRSLSVTQSLFVSRSNYFLAYVIFMAQVAVILKPCSASLATPACVSLSNSTKAMSCFPGTSRTSLNPGNLPGTRTLLTHWFWFL